MISYKKQLEVVRQYTGDAFKTARGYDARKPPSFGKRMAVLKYYRKIAELTAVETQVYTPKSREMKREAFNYTGQTGFNKFTKAIVRKASPSQDFRFEVDKTKPKNHRFVAVDKNTGRRYYSVPAHLFNGEDIDVETYREVLEEYAADAEFFLINAGEVYMWGAGGGRDKIAEKLVAVFRNYSSTQFDANDRNSSYYGNWFRGVTGFTSRYDILPEIGQALAKQKAYREKFHIKGTAKYREILGYGPNGRRLIGEFKNGERIAVHESAPPEQFLGRARDEGFNAFRNGHILKDNPYMTASANWKLWRNGWLAAQRAQHG